VINGQFTRPPLWPLVLIVADSRQNVISQNKTRCSAIAETALQGTLVLAESGRLELGDNILLKL